METGQRHKDVNTRREFERLQRNKQTSTVQQIAAPAPQGASIGGAGIPNKVRMENVGSGENLLVEGGIRPLYNFKTLIAGTNIELESTETEVTINSTGMPGGLPPGTINQTLRHTGVGVDTYEATSRVLVRQYTPLLGGGVHGVSISSPATETAWALQVDSPDGGAIESYSARGSIFGSASSVSTTTMSILQTHSSAASVALGVRNDSSDFQAYAVDARAYKRTLNVQTMFLNTLNENTYAGYFVNGSGLNTGYRGIGIYATATGIRKRAAQFDLSTSDTSNIVVEINTPNAVKGLVVNAPGSPRSVATNNAAITIICTDSTHLGLNVEGYIHSYGSVNTNTAFTYLDTPVVGQRRSGWDAATGTATRTTFNTATVTVSQLAERVKGLIDDLLGHGLIGN